MKRSLLAGAILFALTALAGPAQAQTGAARGRVVDEKGQPVAEAKVEIDFQGGVTRKLETKTNKKGEFTQVGLTPGQYKITATKEGFQGGYVEYRIGLGDPTQVPEIKLASRGAGGAAAGGAAADTAVLQAMFQKGYDLTQAGKLDEAEAAYKEVLAKDATLPAVYYNLGIVYTQKKDWTNAEASFQKALELKPGYSEATSALARVYNESGRPEKGMALMTQGGAENDPKIQLNLGVTLFSSGKSEEAEAAFTRVEALDPNNAEAQYYLGTIAVGKGKIDEAVKRLEKYLSMSPQNAQNKATAEGLLQALKPKK